MSKGWPLMLSAEKQCSTNSLHVFSKFVGDLDLFMNEYWRSKPLLHRSEDPEFLESLLTLADADAILESPATRPPYVEMTSSGTAVREKIWTQPMGSKSLSVPDSVNVDVLAAHFNKGATLILNHLDDYHEQNRAVCACFRDVLGTETKTVAFITPPNQRGLGVHYDTFEGFIVQTHGEKTWYVFEQERPLPVEPKGFDDSDMTKQPVLEVTLRPGDCLYLPWGSPHYATSHSAISCHVTIMNFPVAWSDAVGSHLIECLPRAAGDILAPLADDGQLAEQLPAWIDALVTEARRSAPEAIASRLLALQHVAEPLGSGFLERGADPEMLRVDATLRREPRVPVSTRPMSEGRIAVTIGHVTLSFPERVHGLIDALVDGFVVELKPLADCWGERTTIRVAQQFMKFGALVRA